MAVLEQTLTDRKALRRGDAAPPLPSGPPDAVRDARDTAMPKHSDRSDGGSLLHVRGNVHRIVRMGMKDTEYVLFGRPLMQNRPYGGKDAPGPDSSRARKRGPAARSGASVHAPEAPPGSPSPYGSKRTRKPLRSRRVRPYVFTITHNPAARAMQNDFDNWHYWRPGESAIVEMGTVRGLDVGLPPHFHEEDQITFVFSGRRRFMLGGTPAEVRPGEAVRIPAGVPHRSFADDRELCCLNVYLRPDTYDRDGLSAALTRLCRRGPFAVRRPELEIAVARYCNPAPRPPRESRPISLDETVARLAELSGMSREGFSRHFKRAYGLPPHAFQIMARLNHARELLREGASPILAASEAGFADQSHMGRNFRRFFGVTPGRYRLGKVTSVLEILPQSDTL